MRGTSEPGSPRLIVLAPGLSAVMVALAGCNEPAESPRGRVQGFITVIGVGEDDAAWQALRRAAEARADHYAPLSVRTAAPRTRSTEAQIQLVRAAQREGARGLCVQVDEPAALVGELERVGAAGVVVVTLACPVDANVPFLHSGHDASELGAALADLAAEAVEQRGMVAFVRSSGANPVDAQVDASFVRRMTSHPSVQVLPGLDHTGNLRDTQARVDACAERFPRLGAWAVLDPRLLDGPLDGVLRLAAGETQTRFVAAGCSPFILERLAAGNCFAAVAPDYEQMMNDGLDLCSTMAQGMRVSTRSHEAGIVIQRGRR